MVPRKTNLLGRPAEEIEAILRHPRQTETVYKVAAFITALRNLRRPGDYYDFQRELFGDVFRAQELQAEHARCVKRERRGKDAGAAPLAGWELELAVSDRVVRQLRTVGDGLAWRIFDFDRRFIYALSQNAPVSPMVGKAGLEYELGEIAEIWKRERRFALLHDLTNCLRIGDITKFSDQGPQLIEVKKSPSSGPSRAQRERMQRAIDVILGKSVPVGVDKSGELRVSPTPLKTRLASFASALSIADEHGVSAVSISRQWVVSCLSVTAQGLPSDDSETIRKWKTLQKRAFRKADMNAAKHHLRGSRTIDRLGRSPGSAPLSVYPLDPWLCAKLICDYVSFESVISWERIAEAVEDMGLDVECPLDDRHEDEIPDDNPVLIVRKGLAGLSVPGSGIHQILFEFVEPRAYAAALKDFFVRAEDRRLTFFFTFSNEKAVWK